MRVEPGGQVVQVVEAEQVAQVELQGWHWPVVPKNWPSGQTEH